MKRKERAQRAKALAAVEALKWPAGTVWEIVKPGDGAGLVRGTVPMFDKCLCPLELAAHKRRGHISIWGWRHIAYNLGIPTAVAAEIVLASDGHADHDPEVRAALLRKVGLKGGADG